MPLLRETPEDRKPAAEAPAAPAELAAEVKKAQEDVAGFVGAAKDADDRAKRKGDITTLLGKLKVERVSELAAADAVRLSGAVAKLVERYAPKASDEELL